MGRIALVRYRIAEHEHVSRQVISKSLARRRLGLQRRRQVDENRLAAERAEAISELAYLRVKPESGVQAGQVGAIRAAAAIARQPVRPSSSSTCSRTWW